MTKKDYKKFAALLSDLSRQNIEKSDDLFKLIVVGLCNIFSNDNPRFDQERFVKACQSWIKV